MKILLTFLLSLPLFAFAGGHEEHPGGDAPTMDSGHGEHPGGDAPTMDSGHGEHPGGDAPTTGHTNGERPDGAPVMDAPE